MYFKQIELAGFKSFADRISIKFDSGITAIVGPNGCGKSNVADAIRWVLGEQSSKQLRGTTMQDVIFNGTKKRKSLSYCEATLVFNNQDRFFDFDYDELAITRRLFRSGESEYLINKQPCRLKDIINLFYDSGIGRDGYSIIGQGKVEEIISSRPENRRYIFEEAAGIAKYKSRKIEAERKLERTRDNLTRLRDIITELERQLGPLKKQAETARKYLDLREQLKHFEVNSYIYQYENANQIKDKINEKLNGIKEQLELREQEYEEINREYEKNMESINSIDSRIADLHNVILNLTVELEKQSGETKLIKERIAYLEDQNQRLTFDINQSEQQTLKAEQQKILKQQRIKEVLAELDSLTKNMQQVFAELSKVSSELELIEGETEKRTKSIIDSVDKITDIKSTFSRYQAEIELLSLSSAELKEKIKHLDEKIDSTKELQEQASISSNKAKEQSNQYSNDHVAFTSKYNLINDQLKQAENEKSRLYAQLQVFENRKRLLSEMQAEYEGYAHSVKKLLKESEKNAELKSKMVGVLASLIKVPQQYETAIEVALGAAVQNIVTFNEQGAKDLIQHLKQNQYGRATFLPINTMKPRFLTAEEQRAININGCYGVASKLISFDSKISNVIENLLGSTVIVDNLDTAIKLANNTKYGVKIVTLDGDVVNPQGSYTGGSKKNDAVNLIAREREIETLTKEIEKTKQIYEQVENSIKEYSKELKVLAKQIDDISILKNQAEVISAKEAEKLEAIKANLNLTIEEKMNAQGKLKATETKLEQLKMDLEAMKNTDEGLQEVNYNNEDGQKLTELRKQKEEHSSNLTSIKIKIATLETELESLNQEVSRLDEQIVEQKTINQNNKELLRKNLISIDEARKLISEEFKKQENEQISKQLAEAKNKQVELADEKIELQNVIRNLNDKRSLFIDEITKIKEKKYEQEMLLLKVDSDIETMQQRIYDEYELTYETCLPFKVENFDNNLAVSEINKLKREISKLGYVNVNAIEDVKGVAERYDNLNSQAQDLIKAEQDLVQIITELSQEMELKFKTEFDKINENFKVTFRELFGGGSASLQLLDEQNILESGIEIVAEPPGKSLKSITLLSGGEKALTAIAILFAILKMRALPFVLLDEIEAALDEANVERFAQYLRRFSKNTQFIIITHRKPTMELADSLYGVTMEEEGVSKMVSVKLSDAVKNAKESQPSEAV